MPKIHVHLAPVRDRSYDIEIQPGILERLPERIARAEGARRIFVITDTTVARLYGEKFHRALVHEGADVVLLDFPAGEKSKSPLTALGIQTRLLGEGITRDSLIVALGGGVVGDLAGYVAATILRGVRFIQVPTTLLAQSDSSIGGKVGIDHSSGKNLIGAFHQPSAVYIDPRTLRTLPAEEFRSGLAEVVKIAAALDRRFFSVIERNADRIRRGNEALITRLIAAAVGLKASVVARDERDAGIRSALNLGHSIGHALEASTQFELKHGYAVSIGMVLESRLASEIGLLEERETERLARTLRAAGLPTVPPNRLNFAHFESALLQDKKSDASGLKMTLLRRIGTCALGIPVSIETVRKIMGQASRKRTRG
ncbi:MAG TPA: 3-dehydroquinate synthase [Bacteroidota bacterium]|nr:3-dehydroquinate synthase [Bacteroidota bacterium]